MSRLLEPGALLRGPLVRNFVRGCVPPSLASGELVGPYRIARELDCGGMSAVYLAHRADGEFEHTVALKWGYCGANPRRQRLFRRERQILARLDHPNIARLIDGGSTRDGHLWFAMEWVDGETLLSYLARTGIDWNQRIDLVLPLLDAVAHAHARGFVHCDIKPGNVMIDRRGVPRLLDFGIAGLTGEDPAGTRAFSPGYASPEQLAGRAVGAASDVWQLGRLLHTMMESVRISSRRRREINAITSRAMADDPRRRYPSVAAFSADLKRFAYRQPVHAVGGRLGYVLSCLLRRHPWAVGASVSGSALILVLASLLMAQIARLKTMSAQMESRPAAGIEVPTHDPEMGRGLHGCVVPQCRNPAYGTPIRAQTASKPALARPQLTRQNPREGPFELPIRPEGAVGKSAGRTSSVHDCAHRPRPAAGRGPTQACGSVRR